MSNAPSIRFIDQTAISNSADAANVVVHEGDLRAFNVHLQLTAAAGTAVVQVQGPGGLWVDHTTAIDVTADAIVITAASKAESYKSVRVTFTGTGGTNTIAVALELRAP